MLAKSISGAAAAALPAYIEDVFSTYLYTGNGSTQTITNDIDLSGKGGLVWIKGRSGATDHALYDTARGATFDIASNTTAAQTTQSTGLTSFGSTGFSIGALAKINTNAATYVSWAFREQAKFFDVVTYTGDGVAGRTVPHNLGSVPGCIIVKRLEGVSVPWQVYHRSLGATKYLILSSTAAEATATDRWNDTTPSSTTFTVGNTSAVNASGGTYVAYLFAHDAGGFGLTGTDNVISCGSYTGTGAYQEINLGWEPQWVLVKRASGGTSPWNILDTMRGLIIGDNNSCTTLKANSASVEIDQDTRVTLGKNAATGFAVNLDDPHANTPGSTYIYIAIRRGPMKVPTSGTSVFDAAARADGTGGADITASNTTSSIMFVDLALFANRAGNAKNFQFADKLRGFQSAASASADTSTTPTLVSSSTSAEATSGNALFQNSSTSRIRFSSNSVGAKISYAFKRAPGFFDVVAYTGTGGTGSRSLSHNLQAVPEFIILKRRDAVSGWQTGSMFTSTTVTRAVLNLNNDQDLNSLYSGQSIWGGQPTSSAFLIDSAGSFNTSAATYIAYLFATVTGVSKVGSYTGTGTTKQIDCGFTGGARFVLIKRTDSTGDWYVWDTARGIVSGNDPYLLLNSSAAEVTNTDYIDTYSAGFEISSTAPAAINANGGTFIFLAIA